MAVQTGSQKAPAAIYLRLSSADGPDSESNSIQNQRALLHRWAEENGFAVTQEFVDDGHTGTDFDRPGFRDLSARLLDGSIRCLIVKDLSRLGRNYAQTGKYLEETFPRLGVRFIAVNDGYDSASNTASATQMAVFKNVFNDWYAQEASTKVRASLAVLKKQGKFLNGQPPYGYSIDAQDRYHLVPNPETAPVVQRIFRQFLAGDSCKRIAHDLTQDGIPTPAQYGGMSKSHPDRHFNFQWHPNSIRTMLANPTYQGDLTQQWTRTVSHKVHERRRLPPEERITVRDTHAPLVSREGFAQAQSLLKARRYESAQQKPGHAHLLTGLAFCADCGSPMYAKKRGKYWYLNCYGYYRDPTLRRCTAHSIREDAVLEAVLAALRREAQSAVDTAALAREKLEELHRANTGAARLRELERKRERTRQARLDAYKDKAAGVLTAEDFTYISENLRREEDALARQIKALQTRQAQTLNAAQVQRQIENLLRFEMPNKAQLHQLVRRVEIDDDKNITIEFTFRDPHL